MEDGGFRRMQIVEVSDDESDEADETTAPLSNSAMPAVSAAPAGTVAQDARGGPREPAPWQRVDILEAESKPVEETPSTRDGELFPDLPVEVSRHGVEAAKNQGNSLFGKGALEESLRWFSKGLWLVESKQVTDVPSDLQSILHANRSFAYIKLQRWHEAEKDCSTALSLNPHNTKAKYRRAKARFELGLLAAARQDIEEVMEELPDPKANKEAAELHAKISAKSEEEEARGDQPTVQSSSLGGGWRRMEIVEASDDEEEEGKIGEPVVVAAGGSGDMCNVEPRPEAPRESPKANLGSPAVPELHPELKVDFSLSGVQAAKACGNSAFARGLIEESVKWFSKGLWTIDAHQLTVPSDLHSVLYSNRSFAHIKLKKWPQAEFDATAALSLQAYNLKAKYRRAMARLELGSLEGAMHDVNEVLKEWPDPKSRSEAVGLKETIAQRMVELEAKEAALRPEAGGPREPAGEGADLAAGWRRLEIAEDDDESEDEGGGEASVEPFPELKVEMNLKGVEVAKNKGNSAFAKGSLEEALGWFSKALWLAESKHVSAVSSELRSVLHSNRAFVRIKLQRWSEAEEDCRKALNLNGKNTKARYRRAMVRVELGALDDALLDVELVLKELPDPHSSKEASELKQKIVHLKAKSSQDHSLVSGSLQQGVAKQLGESAGTELFPDLSMELSAAGVEAAKNRGNAAFSKGLVEESLRWFSKGLWLVETKKIKVPVDLQSILHANRSFTYIKLQRWREAEKDCSDALALNGKNTKARYRRAMARFELGLLEAGLQDVEDVLKELPHPASTHEAVELKQRIREQLEKRKTKDTEVVPKASVGDTSSGWRRLNIVEASDDEEEVTAVPGAADFGKDVGANRAPPQTGELFPDLKIEFNSAGVEAAKNKGNASFSKGALEESVKWFSKGLWVLETQKVTVPSDLHSILHSNRSFANIKLGRWSDAEKDSSAALLLNEKNTKARYRRAMARYELGMLEAAQNDLDDVLKELPYPGANPEVAELQQKILQQLDKKRDNDKPVSRYAAGDDRNGEKDALAAAPAKKDSDMEAASPTWKASTDPFPELTVELSAAGVEAAKNRGNAAFSKGLVEESLRWFSKGLWAVETKKVTVPSDLQSILHANRSFTYIKLQRWTEAEQDCSDALTLNGKNTKARYRRAMARFELGSLEAALQDVEDVLKELPHPASMQEAVELKQRIREQLEKGKTKDTEVVPKASVGDTSSGWRRLTIVEASDDEEEVTAVPGAADFGKDVGANRAPPQTEEFFPDLQIEFSAAGVEAAKNKGNASFSKGALEESVKWFSKGLWVLETQKVTVPSDLHSILHSNRSFANIKLGRWSDAEKDSSAALLLNEKNTKARYRRAMARYELGMLEAAQNDLDYVLRELPNPASNPEAAELKQNILQQLDKKREKDKPVSKDATSERKDQGKDAPAAAPARKDFEGKAISPPSKKLEELFPELSVELSAAGVEAAKNAGNTCFSKGSVEESIRWFSKGLWAVETQGVSVPSELHSILHANRSFAYLKQRRWSEAERDCSHALDLNGKNTKARYRRALARSEMGSLEGALRDIEDVQNELPPPMRTEEIDSLKQKIMRLLQEREDKEEKATPKPPPEESSGGWRRMEIVEGSDDESEDEVQAEALAPDAELFPDLKVDFSMQGVEAAKSRGNGCFAEGFLEESLRWFSKGIWLIESKRVNEAPQELQSILHSNRAFVYIKMQKWAEAEADCSIALSLNAKSTKAKYRRAMARYELGTFAPAMQDVECVLEELPRDASNIEALELKRKIGAKLKETEKAETQQEAALLMRVEEPIEKEPPSAVESSGGWRRMEIVEASDDESEAEVVGDQPGHDVEQDPDLKVDFSVAGVEAAKNQGNASFSHGNVEDSVRWFSKGLWLIQTKQVAHVTPELHSILHANRAFAYIKLQKWSEAEADCCAALSMNAKNTKATYRRALARFELGQLEGALADADEVLKVLSDPVAGKDARQLRDKIVAELQATQRAEVEVRSSVKQPERLDPSAPSGRRPPSVVEGESNAPEKGSPEEEFDPHPELSVEFTVAGLEAAKSSGNTSFSKGSLEDSVKWFSKALWIIDSKRVTDVPSDMHSAFHSNRSFAYIKLGRWAEAEADARKALVLNNQNTKARYRRAMALAELGKVEEALRDLDDVLQELPDPNGNKEAAALKKKLVAQLDREARSPPPAPPPSPGADKASPLSDRDPFPDLQVEPTAAGIEQGKDKGNLCFAEGSFEDAVRWFSKCIWTVYHRHVDDLAASMHSILHSNRAYALIRLKRWSAAEEDCVAAFALNSENSKALYRRAWARFELGKLEAALVDVEQVLHTLPAHASKAEAQELKERILNSLGSKVGGQGAKGPPPAAAGALAEPPPRADGAPTLKVSKPQRSAKAAAAAAAEAMRGAPNVPLQNPRNSLELLRNFNSLKRHPVVLARYVRERVPPSLVAGIFGRSPIEPDDLALFLSALRTNAKETDPAMSPELVAEYLRQLLRTHAAETQFAMLSSREKQVVQELLSVLTDSSRAALQSAFTAAFG